MLYLSKGMVRKQMTAQGLCVIRCGMDYILTGVDAKLWLDGRLDASTLQDVRQVKHLEKLQQLGLVELSEEAGTQALYQLLSRCIIYPAKQKSIRESLTLMEQKAWQWLSKAGLRLTIGELTKLFTDDVTPSPDLLGKENTQALVLKLYATDMSLDTTLEIHMECAPRRDEVVTAVLGLLSKKRIILI